ncbi:MAG TPA: CPBP family intramembrane glutamic endopeptidase [Candidatus Saccharimonadales bacterium]|nr:CPBP family intramembrane glutamic endopeptidase [Candidatus Saccharimonadales bacterium]
MSLKSIKIHRPQGRSQSRAAAKEKATAALYWLIFLSMALMPAHWYIPEQLVPLEDMVSTQQAWQLYLSTMTSPVAIWILPLGVVINLGLAYAVKKINSSRGWLNWSLSKTGSNTAQVAAEARLSGLLYLALFAYCLPFFVNFEEHIFRVYENPLVSWVMGSLVFGLAHLLSKARLKIVYLQILVGLVLVIVYQQAGLWPLIAVHTTANLTALTRMAYHMQLKPRFKHLAMSSAYRRQVHSLAARRSVRRHLPTVLGWLERPLDAEA